MDKVARFGKALNFERSSALRGVVLKILGHISFQPQ